MLLSAAPTVRVAILPRLNYQCLLIAQQLHGSIWPSMILHVDMDAYYASVEQLDNAELRGKPVIVGGSPKGRGVVSAASYEARKYGVRSAMPTAQAYKLCPHGHFVSTRMNRYIELSKQIRGIFERFTPDVEPLSIDEAFLDVNGCVHLFGGAEKIGREIKHAILSEVGLVASVGIAPNKFLAKLASDLDKPNGFTVIPPDRILQTLEPLSVSRLWGVGKATLRKFEHLSLHTFGDLQRLTVEQAVGLLGPRMGNHFWRLARGLDSRAVQSSRQARTVSNEWTFSADIDCPTELKRRLLQLTDKVAARLRQGDVRGRTVNLKVRFTGFETITRAQTLPRATNTTDAIRTCAEGLLMTVLDEHPNRKIRLLGIGLSNLEQSKPMQLELFPEDDEETQETPVASQLDRATDLIRQQFGSSALQRGSSLKPPAE